jgi:cob(I)alamin adenosyltransferase
VPIRINRVYTRTGDRGQTRLVGGAAVRKDSPRVEAYGTVDELNSVLGLARTWNERALSGPSEKEVAARRELDEILKRLQNELFDLGSELATPPEGVWPGMLRIADDEVTALERCIDRCQKDLAPLKSFILPGGDEVSAFLHQARTVCRRAERRLLVLMDAEDVGTGPLRYLNRLSDLLFVLARWVSFHTGAPEYLWEHGLHLEKKPAAAKTASAPARKAARPLADEDAVRARAPKPKPKPKPKEKPRARNTRKSR